VTKADLVEHITRKIGFSRRKSAEAVDSLLELFKETLERGEKIKISRFGSFQVMIKKGKKGRNPRTGEEVQIPARKVLIYRPSPLLKKILNKP